MRRYILAETSKTNYFFNRDRSPSVNSIRMDFSCETLTNLNKTVALKYILLEFFREHFRPATLSRNTTSLGPHLPSLILLKEECFVGVWRPWRITIHSPLILANDNFTVNPFNTERCVNMLRAQTIKCSLKAPLQVCEGIILRNCISI